MSNFTTELMNALFKGEGVEEIMRLELESAMNELLKVASRVFSIMRNMIQEVITAVIHEMDSMSDN